MMMQQRWGKRAFTCFRAVFLRVFIFFFIIFSVLALVRFFPSDIFKSIKDINSIAQIADIISKKSNSQIKRSLAGVKNVGDSVTVYQKELPNCPYFNYLQFVPKHNTISFLSSPEDILKVTKSDIIKFVSDCKNAFGDNYKIFIIPAEEKVSDISIKYKPAQIVISWSIQNKIIMARFIPENDLIRCHQIDNASEEKLKEQRRLQSRLGHIKDQYYSGIPFMMEIYESSNPEYLKSCKPITTIERNIYLTDINL